MTDISEIWAAQLLKMSHDIRQADKGNIITHNDTSSSDANDGGAGYGQRADFAILLREFGRWHIGGSMAHL